MDSRKIFADFSNTQTKYYLGSITGLGLSLILAISGNKMASGLSLMSLSFGAGIAISSTEVRRYSDKLKSDSSVAIAEVEIRLKLASSDLDRRQELIDSLQSQVSQVLEQLAASEQSSQEYQQKVNALTIALGQAKDSNNQQVSEAITTLEQEFEQKLELAKRELIANCESDKKQHHQECLGKIKKFNSEHRRREQHWIKLLDEKDTLLTQKDLFYREKLSDSVNKFNELIGQYEQVLSSYHPELKEIQSLFKQQMQSVIEERDRIYQQLALYHKAQPFTGSTKADINGNKLIDFYLEKGIVCDAVRCLSHFEYDEIWIRPRTTTLAEIEKYSSEIHLYFELLYAPSFHIEDGCIKVVLRTHSKEKSATSSTIDEQPDNWLEAVVRDSNHYRISAPTDAGKSVFLDNLIGCLQLIHSEEFKLTLLDPKYPFTPWQNHQPDYEGFEQCLEGMERLGELIESRLDEAKRDKEAGRAIRIYPAHLFAVDEMELLVDEARDRDDGALKGKTSMRLTRLLRKGLKLGRGLTTVRGKGILVAYVTQSPLCSRINLNKDDFDNSTNIFLGENISRALSEELKSKLSDKQIAYLNHQYQLRKQRGDNYFALVKTPKDAFIATLPTEGYYSNVVANKAVNNYQELNSEVDNSNPTARTAQSLHIESHSDSDPQHGTTHTPLSQPSIEGSSASQHCPNCQSLNIKKNGKTRGKQYFKCNDCGKSFSSK